MTTDIRFRVFANLYKDSVALMQVGAALRERPGVVEASCLMATPANLAQLQHADLSVDAGVHPSDLLVVVRGEAQACDDALDAAQALLQSAPADVEATRRLLDAADEHRRGCRAIPGRRSRADFGARRLRRRRGDEGAVAGAARDAVLRQRRRSSEELAHQDVMRDARGLLVMGPDCGTAIINGVPLGFANVVRRGGIGLVAASGTGLAGGDLPHPQPRRRRLAGARHRRPRSSRRDRRHHDAARRCARSPTMTETRVIVLISKPPSPAVAARILAPPAACGQAGRRAFPRRDARHGAGRGPARGHIAGGRRGHRGRARRRASDAHGVRRRCRTIASRRRTALAARWRATQRTVRGLFTGGTFCYEAQLAFLRRGLPCRSNAPVAWRAAVDGRRRRSRLHRPGRRRVHARAAASDDRPVAAQRGDSRSGRRPATAAILLSTSCSASGRIRSGRRARATRCGDAQRAAARTGASSALIGHVCGTDGDPQDRAAQVRTARSRRRDRRRQQHRGGGARGAARAAARRSGARDGTRDDRRCSRTR